jgi:hypothetical protein
MAWATTFRNVAGNVQEITFLLTLWTYIRWRNSRDDKAAFAAFPEGLTALGADISSELTVGSVTTVGTHIFLLFVFHSSLPPVSLVYNPPQGILE